MELRSFGSGLCFPLHFGFFYRCHRVQVRCQRLTAPDIRHARAATYHRKGNKNLNGFFILPFLRILFQDDLYLCSTKQPVATRKPLDGGYQDLDYRYLYRIPWPQLVGANTSANKNNLNNKPLKPNG